ncbi:hypothetical protein [Priestia megaterium]|uniref:hypothetical protein n=1 Tax=Priestia megaterium TaxID=1404 RepID=UPI002E2047F2|nr:hypothetical protein [Priestia megaterium]
MGRIKLSQLSNGVEVSIEESSTVYTVAELKHEILELGEEHHLSPNWYTVVRHKWAPSAESMIDSYLENESCELYEDFYSAAMDEMSKGAIEKIQSTLNEVFENNNICDYWTYEKPVEIDIYPNGNKKVTFEVTKDIRWDNWGQIVVAFTKGQVCEGVLHKDGNVSAESPYYSGISDCVDSDSINILNG